jgi:hypothetical protein
VYVTVSPSTRRTGYATAIEKIVESLEGLCNVNASSDQYLAALEDAQGRVEAWFEASIAAAKDDVARQEGE